MKKKKFIMYFSIIILILIILLMGILIIKNNKNKENINEYTPAQEITEEQLRQTNVVLYFLNPKTQEIEAEIRRIDSKELIEKPENKLIEYLIEGPKNNNLEKIIPEGTKLTKTEIKNGILYISFSNKFELNEQKIVNKIKESILKTVEQLNEINKVEILN